MNAQGLAGLFTVGVVVLVVGAVVLALVLAAVLTAGVTWLQEALAWPSL